MAEVILLRERSRRAAMARESTSGAGRVGCVAAIQSRIHTIEQQLVEDEAVIRDHNAMLGAANEKQTAAKIELARAEQKLEAISAALQQSTRNQQERLQAVEEARQELERLRHKQQANELEVLRLTSELAHDYLRCEAEDSKLDGLAIQAAELRKQRSVAAKRLDSVSRSIDKLGQRVTAVG